MHICAVDFFYCVLHTKQFFHLFLKSGNDKMNSYHFHSSFVNDRKGAMANEIFGTVFIQSNGIHGGSECILMIILWNYISRYSPESFMKHGKSICGIWIALMYWFCWSSSSSYSLYTIIFTSKAFFWHRKFGKIKVSSWWWVMFIFLSFVTKQT